MRLEHLARYGLGVRSARREPPAIEPSSPLPALQRAMGGQIVERGEGSCHVVQSDYPSGYQHGPLHTLSDLSAIAPRHLALISRDSDLAYFDVSRAVFLDTETTGLGLGAGTYVFLVGAGYLDGGRFRVRQFFLHTPTQEAAFLAELGEFLDGFAAMITFNGKAFDWPLLENRYVLQRRPPPFDDPTHVDLLHPARRLWKRRLSSCALSSLEREILGVTRTVEDVPGWQIPSLYFRFLQTGDAGPLQRVFYHNLHDVLSLAALALHIEHVVSDPFGGLVEHASDLLCLGRAYDRAGRVANAIPCYEEAVRRGLARGDRADCLLWLAAAQKRHQMSEDSKHTWTLLRDEGGTHALIALVELAKHHEHVERDDEQALEHVDQALRLSRLYQCPWPGTDALSLERRQARLLKRRFRQRSGRGSKRHHGAVPPAPDDWDVYAELRQLAGQRG